MDEQFPLSSDLRVGNDGDVRCDPYDEYRSPILETSEFIARLPTLLVRHNLVGPGRLKWERSQLSEMSRAAGIREQPPDYVTGVVWRFAARTTSDVATLAQLRPAPRAGAGVPLLRLRAAACLCARRECGLPVSREVAV